MLPANSLRFGLALLLALALAACQAQQSDTEETPPADAGEAERVEPSNGGSDAAEGDEMTQGKLERMGLESAVDAALQDLAERSGVTPETISVVQAREVTWRNGALGCPEEDMMYTQALVEGFYILLSDGEREYAYHAGRDGKPFFCPADRSQLPPEDDSALY